VPIAVSCMCFRVLGTYDNIDRVVIGAIRMIRGMYNVSPSVESTRQFEEHSASLVSSWLAGFDLRDLLKL